MTYYIKTVKGTELDADRLQLRICQLEEARDRAGDARLKQRYAAELRALSAMHGSVEERVYDKLTDILYKRGEHEAVQRLYLLQTKQKDKE